MFVKSIGSGNVQESTKKKLVKVSAMEKELRELQADPESQKESPKVDTIEPEVKNKSKLGIVKGLKNGGSNAQYESALKALPKQQMLLGKVLDTKFYKEYGNTGKKDFKVLKQIEINSPNALDACSGNDQTRDPRDTVVGEPPPVKGDLNMANPYSSPAESGNKVNYPAREPHTYIEALHRPLPKHHPQRVQEVRKYLDRKDHGKMNIQNLFKDEKINLDVHRATDMEKGEKGKHELGKNLMWTQGEVADLQKMIIELKPKSGATVKEFSSPATDTEITDDLETVKRGSYTVISGYEEASYKQELQLDFSSNESVAIIRKVEGLQGT